MTDARIDSPKGDSFGNWEELFDSAFKTIAALPAASSGAVLQLDAAQAISIGAAAISTDPPYYDNVGYAVLSDFYYVWLRRSLSPAFPALFATVLAPKSQELIASPYRHEGRRDAAQSFFEEGLERAFENMRRAHVPDLPITVYYAFKQSEEEVEEDEGGFGSSTVSTG